MARKPRTHDLAIDRLRKESLRLHKEAQDTATSNVWASRCEHGAAAMDLAADFLNDIQGVVERKPKRRGKIVPVDGGRIVRGKE